MFWRKKKEVEEQERVFLPPPPPPSRIMKEGANPTPPLKDRTTNKINR